MPISFDTETTSFKKCGNKYASMYVWAINFDGLIYIGRTWAEFIDVINFLAECFQTGDNLHLIIFVHNLAFDFQFFRRWLRWGNVFATDNYKPLKAVTVNGIEFRCNYMLSGYSLEQLSKTYKLSKKLNDDFDYDLQRFSFTKLTRKELHYLINDVKIVVEYIKLKVQEFKGNYANIPLTKTGIVRNNARKKCFERKYYASYKALMNSVNLTVDEYHTQKMCFAGGFTHAGYYHANKTIKNVRSFDKSSAYPFQMCIRKFPMCEGVFIKNMSVSQLTEIIEKKQHCIFKATFKNIASAIDFEHYISKHKCIHLDGGIFNNGRVMYADVLTVYITEIDFEIISKFYVWDEVFIHEAYFYPISTYLPFPLVDYVLTLYEQKTQLKNVDGKEFEYLLSKESINSCYGMAVTDIVQEDTSYNDEKWVKNSVNYSEKITKYNNSFKRFLLYIWGVYVTNYCRQEITNAILNMGATNYVYTDTDSVKFIDDVKKCKYYQTANDEMLKAIHTVCGDRHIPLERFSPKDKDGISHTLGLWEDEGIYSKFKTLGAKRYLVEKNNKIELTCAGVNKKTGSKYLTTFENPFDAFKDGLIFSGEHSGKKTHTYIDDKFTLTVTDYLGVKGVINERSYIHLEDADYTLGITEEYKMLWNNLTKCEVV